MRIDQDTQSQQAADDAEENYSIGTPLESVQDELSSSSDRDQVEQRAYYYWLERGCPDGCPDEDWFRAERESTSAREGS